MKTRSGEYDVDTVLALDKKRRDILKEVETLKAERNRESGSGSPRLKRKKGTRRKLQPRLEGSRRQDKSA